MNKKSSELACTVPHPHLGRIPVLKARAEQSKSQLYVNVDSNTDRNKKKIPMLVFREWLLLVVDTYCDDTFCLFPIHWFLGLVAYTCFLAPHARPEGSTGEGHRL